MRKAILSIIIILFATPSMAQEIKENILENATYKSRMEHFKNNPLEKGKIIFLGNSLTQGGHWDEYFPNEKPINRGIAGDNTSGVLGRLHKIIAAKPQKIFILIGINDIALSRSEKKIITNIKSILLQIQDGSPDTKIYVQSLLPINNDFGRYSRLKGKESAIVKINNELKQVCKTEQLTFINLYPHFLDKKNKLNSELTGDGLHLNEKGYAIWVEQIGSYVKND